MQLGELIGLLFTHSPVPVLSALHHVPLSLIQHTLLARRWRWQVTLKCQYLPTILQSIYL